VDFNIQNTNYYIRAVLNGWELLHGRKKEFIYYFQNLEALIMELKEASPEKAMNSESIEEISLLSAWAQEALQNNVDRILETRKTFKDYLGKYKGYQTHDRSLAIKIYDSRYILQPAESSWQIVRSYDNERLGLAFRHCSCLAQLFYSLPNLILQLKEKEMAVARSPFELYELSIFTTIDFIEDIGAQTGIFENLRTLDYNSSR
jgi:hypothetical protein